MAEKVKIDFKINTAILPASGYTIDQIRSSLSILSKIFGNNYVKYFPTEINDNRILANLMRLSKNLSMLSDCEGFDEHVKGYYKNPRHTNLLTELSAFLKPKVDSLILEPKIPNVQKRPDILVKSHNVTFLLECKSVQTNKYDYSKQHQEFYNIIKKYVNVPHQVTIKYKTPLSRYQIIKLGQHLAKQLFQVSADGTIIHNENIEVGVIIRTNYGSPMINVIVDMDVQDLNDNKFYPAQAYLEDGKSISIAGPLIDFSKVIKKKIKDSRKQSTFNYPYILVIDSSGFLGDMKENIRVVQTSFQPTQNTRFCGVLFVRQMNTIIDYKLEFHFIGNPYTKIPLPKEVIRLFQ